MKRILLVFVMTVCLTSTAFASSVGSFQTGTAGKPKRLSSISELRKILDTSYARTNGGNAKYEVYNQAAEASPDMKAFSSSAVSADSRTGLGGGTEGFSSTNVQVEGVYESDVVKTDGSFIYCMDDSHVTILSPDLKTVSKIKSTKGEHFSELYIKDNKLIVTGIRFEESPDAEKIREKPNSSPKVLYDVAYYRLGKNYTIFRIYDVSNKAKPIHERSVDMEGYSVSTRLIGDVLYFITNKFNGFYMPEAPDDDIVPTYYDSVVGKDRILMDAKKISYFPDSLAVEFMLIGALNIKEKKETSVESFLGSGTTMYMNTSSLYLLSNSGNSTGIYHFGIKGTDISFQASSSIKGYVLNQYSMDEHKGYFRVAATDFSGGRGSLANSVYIFDDKMKLAGSVTGLAKGETIQSVRFLGDTGYVVTFEQTDPLFVIDLKDPKAPKVVGELKIPGFSTYLHPFKDNYLLGIGRDTTEIYTKDKNGKETVVGFRDIGMKVTLFDVSNPQAPKEKITKVIGDEFCWSEAGSNPKALMVDKSRSYFGLTLNQNNKSITNSALILKVTENSIDIAADLSPEDYFASYSGSRLCYIGNTLYYISGECVYAYDYNTFKEKAVHKSIFNY